MTESPPVPRFADRSAFPGASLRAVFLPFREPLVLVTAVTSAHFSTAPVDE